MNEMCMVHYLHAEKTTYRGTILFDITDILLKYGKEFNIMKAPAPMPPGVIIVIFEGKRKTNQLHRVHNDHNNIEL